jgi:hypothetical protein
VDRATAVAIASGDHTGLSSGSKVAEPSFGLNFSIFQRRWMNSNNSSRNLLLSSSKSPVHLSTPALPQTLSLTLLQSLRFTHITMIPKIQQGLSLRQVQVESHYSFTIEYVKLVEQIRMLNRFENFLCSKPFSDPVPACASGACRKCQR